MSTNQKLRRAENRDKRLRFSIRKFNVGVASVAVAAFFMVNGSSVSADSIENTAVDVVETVETSEESLELADEDPEPELVQEEAVVEVAEEVAVAETIEEVEPAAEEAGENLAEEEAETVETEPVEAEESQADSAEETEEAVEEEKVEAKKESTETSAASITERSAVEVSTRTASVIYRVRYVDEETGQVVYQRNHSASEETTDAEEVAHDFNVTVALELDTADALAGYVLAESQEVAIRNNAIEAVVTERGNNRNLVVNVRKDDVSANNNADEDTFTQLNGQNVNKGGITRPLSQRIYNYYENFISLNGQPAVYVTGDGLSAYRTTFLVPNRSDSINKWDESMAYWRADENQMFSNNRSGIDYLNTYSALGQVIAHQINLTRQGLGYEQGVDEVYIDFSQYFVLADNLARQGYKVSLTGISDNNIPTGLTYDYETGVLSGKIRTGIENGANWIDVRAELLDPNGNVVGTGSTAYKFNIFYQDETAPELEVSDIYSAVANEKLSVQMVYPTEAEQQAAKEAYGRGEIPFYFNVTDNGWSVPYGNVVRDQNGNATDGTRGNLAYNNYYGLSDSATQAVTDAYNVNSVLAVDVDVHLEDDSIQANSYDIKYNYNEGTLDIESKVAGIYEVTVTANDYRFSKEMQGTTLGPWDHIVTPQESQATFTLHILPTVEIGNADTASDALDVTVAAGSTEADIELPNGDAYKIVLDNGVWKDQDGNVLTYTTDPATEKITVNLPVDYHGLTEVGDDVIKATVRTEDGLVNSGTGNITNTPPKVDTQDGVEQLGKTVDLLDPAYVTGISDNEDDRHDNPTPDDKVTTVTRVVVTDPNGQRQVYEGADLTNIPQELDTLGDYTVTVTVTDSDGATNDNSYTITVNPLQKAVVNYYVQDYYDAAIDENTGNIIDTVTGQPIRGITNNGDGTYTTPDGTTYTLKQDGNALVTSTGDIFVISKTGSDKLLESDELYGQNGESIANVMRDPETGEELGTSYATQDVIDYYKSKGYELVQDNFDPTATYDTNTAVDQVFNVYLRERIEPVYPNTKPGEPVDPSDPNSPVYPDTVENVKLNEEVTRTIHYLYAKDNATAAPSAVETLNFSRPVFVNMVTGELIEGAWAADNGDWTFDEVTSPRVLGYLGGDQTVYSGTRPKIDARTLTQDEVYIADYDEYVYYSAGNNIAFVQYVDRTTGEIIIGNERSSELDMTIGQAMEEATGQPYTGDDANNYLIDIDTEEDGVPVDRSELTKDWNGLPVRGDSDEPISYDPATELARLERMGYTVVENPLAEGHTETFTAPTKDYQLYQIIVEHKVEPVNPGTNPIPGEPVDPDNPNSPNWPASAKDLKVEETVKRTIEYVDEAGNTLEVPVEQVTDTFSRTGYVDLVTGETSETNPEKFPYTDWSEAQELPKQDSPVIQGYITETVTVPAVTVNAEDEDITEKVVYKPLGKYIINTPDVVTPSEVYPNDDEGKDPSTTGTPTTIAPYVPGYTPTTEDGQPLTPVDPADPTKGYTVPAVPEDPTKDTIINYVGNEQKANIKYVDQDDKELANDPETGLSNQPIDYSTEDRIKAFEKAGYELVEDGFPADATYDDDDTVDQEYIVKLKERVIPITPDAVPGEPVDPTDPNSPVWPDTITSIKHTRTINYVYEDGTTAADTVEQEVTFYGNVNLVTGEVTYDEISKSVDAVDSPLISGYFADRAEVSATAFKPASEDIVETVTYRPFGSYVFDIPEGKDPVDSEKYPNDPLDPSRVGQVETTAPYVDGYTPFIPAGDYSSDFRDVNGDPIPLIDPEDPSKGYTLNPVDPEDPTKGYVVPVLPVDWTVDTHIGYIGNEQKATVKFVYKTDKSELADAIAVSGPSNTVIGDTTATDSTSTVDALVTSTLASLRQQGYFVAQASDNEYSYGGTKKFDEDDEKDQEYTIYLSKRGMVIIPDVPNDVIAQEILDSLKENVKRTVEYVDNEGNKLDVPAVTKSADFERTVIIDETTGQVITDGDFVIDGVPYTITNGTVTIGDTTYTNGYSDWTVADSSEVPAKDGDSSTAAFPAEENPVVPGYILTDDSQNTVRELPATNADVVDQVIYTPVGKVIVTPPTGEPTETPYPNDPEDPAKIDDPNTNSEIPEVPGYVPVDKDGNVIPKDEDGNYIVPTPEDPTKDTVITYQPVGQKATITYVNESKDNAVLHTDERNGNSDSPIGYSTAEKIAELEKQGYELVKDGYPADAKFDTDDKVDQAWEVVLKERIVDVPEGVVPGEPVDPTDPNSPVWPDTVKDLVTTEEVIRTITYVDEAGNEVSETVTETKRFTRPATVNLVTGEVEFGAWTSAQDFEEVKSPVVDGYLADKDKVDAKTVNATDEDINEVVTYKPLGQWIPNLPETEDPIDPIVYPNNPEDPTQPGDDKPVVPHIPGYVPVDSDGNPLTPVDPEDPTKGYEVPDVPTNPSQDTPINYKSVKQTARVNYVIESVDPETGETTGSKVDKTATVTGNPDEEIEYSTQPTISDYLKAGYELVSDEFKPGTTFDSTEDVDGQEPSQVFTVTLKERVEPVDPTNPPKPGEPVDPTDPDSPVWPDEVKDLVTTEKVTRTITYVDKDGKEVSETVTETKTFTRPATVNLVTGEVVYGEWTPAQDFEEKVSPVVEGYLADKKSVPAATVNATDEDIKEQVVYTPVGKVIINIPEGSDVPTPDPDPYPNNPEDPTDIDDPTTPIPEVPGYVPVTEDGTELPKDEDGNYVPPTPTDPTKDTIINYVEADQRAIFNYVLIDEAGNSKLDSSASVPGKTEAPITYSTAAKIADYLKAGYELVSDAVDANGNPYVAGTTAFDNDETVDQVFTVTLKERVIPVDPTDPDAPKPVPGEPVDPTDPNSPVWPDTVKDLVTTEEVTRTITYVDENGKEVSETVTETKTFTRTADINLVTGVITYGDWTPAQDFAEKVSPVVDGYIADKKAVPAATVNATDEDIKEVVTYKPLGQWIPNLPETEDPIDPIVYPNDPEDPTVPGTETPVVPYVPGYTPVDPEGNPLPPVDPEDPTKGYDVPEVPEDPTKDTVINYVANPQQATVTYVDTTGKELVPVVELSGKTDEVIDYDTTPTIEDLIKKGYELVTDEFAAAKDENGNVVYDNDDDKDQNFVVTLKERVVEVPKDAQPGQPVDPTDPNSPVWPDNIKEILESNGQETVTRTITYVDENGVEVATKVTQTVEYTRPVYVNLVTGELDSVGEWTTDKSDLDEVTSPVIEGMTADKLTVDKVATTPTTEDINEVVTYTANAVQTAVIVYEFKDQDGKPSKGQETVIDPVTGRGSTPIEYTTEDRIAEFTKKGYDLVKDEFIPGTLFDEDDDVTQRFVVSFVERVVPVDPENPPVPGQPVDPTDPNSPVWPDTVNDIYFERTVTRTITYVDDKGNEVSETVTEEVTFSREATVNLVTGEIVYNDWSPAQSFDAKTSPVVKGYLADKATVPAVTVTGDSNDINEVVTYKPVGKVIIEVPGQDEPITDPYPNDPEDPTTIDQPTTPIPDVPGYTPVIVDPEDPTNPKPVPTDENGKPVIPVPTDPTKDTEIVYVANDQKAVFNFVDESGKIVANPISVDGKSNEEIKDPSAPTIAELEKAGYVVVSNDFVSGTKFDTDDAVDQHFTVTVKPRIETVDPKDPDAPKPVPGQPVDPTDPNSPVWPDTVENLETTKEITRTITYVDDKGNTVSETVTETVTFTRPVTINLVTGEVTYGEWTSDNATYPEVKSPVVPGYLADKPVVSEQTVTSDSDDITEVVTYKPVGKVIIEVPGQDEPITDPYPNDPEDPTKIDQPTTPIPVIPGYTPVIVNPEDPANPTPVPTDENGKPVVPVPADPTKDTEIVYVADDQKAVFNFVDESGKVVANPIAVDGKSDTVIVDPSAPTIAELEKAGYEVVAKDFVDGTKFDKDASVDQHFTVTVKPRIETVDPNDPNAPKPVPGQPVDPTDPNSPVWPDTVKDLETTKEITRTITYVDKDGKTVSESVTDKVTFTRPVTINLVTGEVTYGEWTTTNPTYPGVDSPIVPGYLADKPVVDASTVTADASSTTVVVTYTPVGNVVIEVPGQDQPSVDPYPNHPTDPTTIDQPTTPIPVVPGYTPVIVDPTDPTKLTPVPVDDKGNYIIPTPENPTQDTTIRYVANDQKVVFNFVDENGQVVATPILVEGKSDTVIVDPTATTIAELEKAGYVVVSTDFVSGTKFDKDSAVDQSFTIVVTPRIEPVGPNTPTPVPGQPVDPTDPNSPVWPDTVKDLETTKEITRTITYVDKNGNTVSETVVNKVTFTRDAKVNLVTGEITYGEWTTTDATYPEVKSPVVKGHIADKSVVTGTPVTPDTISSTEVVTYTPVGNVVIEVPGQDQPTVDPYPNHPTDPTAIDQPTTPIPVIPGYIAVDENGKELPKDEDGNYIVPSPEDPTKDTVIRYVKVDEPAKPAKPAEPAKPAPAPQAETPAPVVEEAPQLPNTGETNDAALTALGLTSLLGAAAVGYRRRKTN